MYDTYLVTDPSLPVTNMGGGEGVVAAPNASLPVMNRRGGKDVTIECECDRGCGDGSYEGINNLASKKRVDESNHEERESGTRMYLDRAGSQLRLCSHICILAGRIQPFFFITAPGFILGHHTLAKDSQAFIRSAIYLLLH